MTITLTIPGNPVGKQRARVCRTGHAFTPLRTVNYETLIRELFAVAYPNHVPWRGPVLLRVTAYFQIPKSTPKKRRAEMETECVWYPHRIDGDNLWKIIADALNGLVYVDDGQVVNGHVLKYYSPRPRVEIEIEELA
jgi:Holliday junction resolvase RusA-like endonuclease